MRHTSAQRKHLERQLCSVRVRSGLQAEWPETPFVLQDPAQQMRKIKAQTSQWRIGHKHTQRLLELRLPAHFHLERTSERSLCPHLGRKSERIRSNRARRNRHCHTPTTCRTHTSCTRRVQLPLSRLFIARRSVRRS